MRLLAHIAALLALGTGVLAAQTTPPVAAPAPAPPAPPAARLDPALVTPYHHTFRMLVVRNGQEQELGSLDDAVIKTQDQGTPALIRLQTVQGPTGTMQDSAVADAVTLLPRRHDSQAANRSLHLEFSPLRVTGRLNKAGDPATPIDQEIADGVYDSNMLDVLLAALPLAPGYAGRVMVYVYEAGGAIPLDVQVTGSEKVKDVDTWIADVTLNKRTVHYYIAKSDHRVAQIVSPVAPGVELRLVR